MTDPINELDELIGRVRHGDMHRFTFDRKGDYTGIQAERLVRGVFNKRTTRGNMVTVNLMK